MEQKNISGSSLVPWELSFRTFLKGQTAWNKFCTGLSSLARPVILLMV